MNTTENMISLIINLEHLLKDSGLEKLDVKLKIMHLISTNKNATPNTLIEKLDIARSNLAIACNNLVKEGMIEKIKNVINKKEIAYKLTQLGEQTLENALNPSETNLSKMRSLNKINKFSTELNKLL